MEADLQGLVDSPHQMDQHFQRFFLRDGGFSWRISAR